MDMMYVALRAHKSQAFNIVLVLNISVQGNKIEQIEQLAFFRFQPGLRECTVASEERRGESTVVSTHNYTFSFLELHYNPWGC